MARVTVEDCLRYVPNRFELVLLAARRTRQLARGHLSTLPLENDKFTVLALREIGQNAIDLDALMRSPLELEEVGSFEEMEEPSDNEAMEVMREETVLAGLFSTPEDSEEPGEAFLQPANDAKIPQEVFEEEF